MYFHDDSGVVKKLHFTRSYRSQHDVILKEKEAWKNDELRSACVAFYFIFGYKGATLIILQTLAFIAEYESLLCIWFHDKVADLWTESWVLMGRLLIGSRTRCPCRSGYTWLQNLRPMSFEGSDFTLHQL